MRRLLLCLALLCFGATAAVAGNAPVHDCLEGGSMDYTPIDQAGTPVPGAGS
jgi:hypothetical protein